MLRYCTFGFQISSKSSASLSSLPLFTLLREKSGVRCVYQHKKDHNDDKHLPIIEHVRACPQPYCVQLLLEPWQRRAPTALYKTNLPFDPLSHRDLT